MRRLAYWVSLMVLCGGLFLPSLSEGRGNTPPSPSYKRSSPPASNSSRWSGGSSSSKPWGSTPSGGGLSRRSDSLPRSTSTPSPKKEWGTKPPSGGVQGLLPTPEKPKAWGTPPASVAGKSSPPASGLTAGGLSSQAPTSPLGENTQLSGAQGATSVPASGQKQWGTSPGQVAGKGTSAGVNVPTAPAAPNTQPGMPVTKPTESRVDRALANKTRMAGRQYKTRADAMTQFQKDHPLRFEKEPRQRPDYIPETMEVGGRRTRVVYDPIHREYGYYDPYNNHSWVSAMSNLLLMDMMMDNFGYRHQPQVIVVTPTTPTAVASPAQPVVVHQTPAKSSGLGVGAFIFMVVVVIGVATLLVMVGRRHL